MKSSTELEQMFFKDLRKFNSTNFTKLAKADLTIDDPVVHKAFSSVITRYFIFREKHKDELTEAEMNMLYFKLKLDMVAEYFSEYPESNTDVLIGFQNELRKFLKHNKDKVEEESNVSEIKSTAEV